MSVTGLYPAFLEYSASDVMTEGVVGGDTLNLGNLPGRDRNGTPLPVGWPFRRKVRVQEVNESGAVEAVYDSAHLDGNSVWTDRSNASGPTVRYKEGFIPSIGSTIRILFILLAMLAMFASETVAQGIRLEQPKTMRMRNRASTTIKKATIVELDTSWTALGRGMTLPDTFPVDTFRVNPNNFGPFNLIVHAYGTVAKDTLYIDGYGVPRRLAGVATPSAITEVISNSLSSDTLLVGPNLSDFAWYSITRMRSRTSGADSVVINISPMFSFQVADSLDVSVVGVVGQDSIPKDSVGIVFTDGIVPAVVFGGSAVKPGSKLQAGTGGHAMLATTTGDTVIAIACSPSKAGQLDTLLIDLQLKRSGAN